MEQEYQYYIKRSLRRSISISIDRSGRINVLAPLSSTNQEIQELLLSKKDWLRKSMDRIKRQQAIVQSTGLYSEQEIREIRKKARKLIPERTAYYAQLMGLKYGRISIRFQRSRWGSCSSDRNLNFNALLVLMPQEVLDSVVVHELCHLWYMNHSKAFYQKVYKYCPDYDRCYKWLKDNGSNFTCRLP